jgi:hypothetical protein
MHSGPVGPVPSATPPDTSADASQSAAPEGSTGPRNVVVVLLDSLNRHEGVPAGSRPRRCGVRQCRDGTQRRQNWGRRTPPALWRPPVP